MSQPDKFKFREYPGGNDDVTNGDLDIGYMIGSGNQSLLPPMISIPPSACDVTRFPGFYRHSDLRALWGRFPLNKFVAENS